MNGFPFHAKIFGRLLLLCDIIGAYASRVVLLSENLLSFQNRITYKTIVNELAGFSPVENIEAVSYYFSLTSKNGEICSASMKSIFFS